MIKKLNPLSMSESFEYLDEKNESEQEVAKFIKKFVKIKPKSAKELRTKIQSMNILKIREEHMSKIIDSLPEDEDSLNKIFTENFLETEESKKVLNLIKEFKQNA